MKIIHDTDVVDIQNEEYKKNWGKYHDHFFEVAGAGEMQISKQANCSGGKPKAIGFSFSVSWGRFGFKGGGVLGLAAAKKMAEMILQECERIGKTEEVLLKEQEEYYERLKTENLELNDIR